jgi:hypothetical protein
MSYDLDSSLSWLINVYGNKKLYIGISLMECKTTGEYEYSRLATSVIGELKRYHQIGDETMYLVTGPPSLKTKPENYAEYKKTFRYWNLLFATTMFRPDLIIYN